MKHTALLIVLWLFCQQAVAVGIAVASVFPRPVDSGLENIQASTQVSCHDASGSEVYPEATMPKDSHQHTDASPMTTSSDSMGQECCDVGCQCCVSGCQSMLGVTLDQTALALFAQHNTSYLSVSPHAPASSLFRPPIIV